MTLAGGYLYPDGLGTFYPNQHHRIINNAAPEPTQLVETENFNSNITEDVEIEDEDKIGNFLKWVLGGILTIGIGYIVYMIVTKWRNPPLSYDEIYELW